MVRPLAASCFFLWSAVLALGAFLAVPAPAPAQRLPTDMNSKDLTDQFDRQRSTRQALLKGTQAAADTDKPVADTMAKWFTNRLTWIDSPRSGDMDKLVHEFEDQVLRDALNNKENNKDFLKLFNQSMMAQFRLVLQNDSMVVKVNGARIMALEGRLGQDELGDLLIEVLADQNQNDAVKFYTLQGMMELFAATRVKPEDREKHCIQAVLDYVAARSNVTATLAQEEADGIRYLRREGIRALGQSRIPAPDKDKANTALVLLRTVARDASLSPPPSVSEQVEATIGLAQLQSNLTPGYQPDYAAYWVGQFLADFSQRYENDKLNPTKAEPWKYEAARMRLALDTWKSDVTNNNAAGKDYVAALVDKATPLLKIIEDGMQQSDATALRSFLDARPANLSTTLFQGNDKTVVSPAAPGGT